MEGRWLFLGGWSGAKSMGRDGGLGVWLEEGLGGVESGGSFSWCPLLWRIYFWNSKRASWFIGIGQQGSCHLQEGRKGAGELCWALSKDAREASSHPHTPLSKMPPSIPAWLSLCACKALQDSDRLSVGGGNGSRQGDGHLGQVSTWPLSYCVFGVWGLPSLGPLFLFDTTKRIGPTSLVTQN